MPDQILTGPPRSGTTLTCYLLNKVPDTIALHEPMNRHHFSDPGEAIGHIRTFFGEMRRSLLRDGQALSKVAGDRIPDNPFPNIAGAERTSLVSKKTVAFDKTLSADFQLFIKHNAHFTFLLPQLLDLYPCTAVIRNPVSVIASWNTIDAPVARGNVTVLQGLNPRLYEELEAIPQLLQRQVRLIDLLFSCYLDQPALRIIRYEDLTRDAAGTLTPLVPAAAGLSEALESRNRNSLYDSGRLDDIRQALLDHGGAYLHFYDAAAICNV